MIDSSKTFRGGDWESRIDVRDFVSHNITPYDGDASFLCGATGRTKHLWQICLDALREERDKGGVRHIDNVRVSTITSHGAGYISTATPS